MSSNRLITATRQSVCHRQMGQLLRRYTSSAVGTGLKVNGDRLWKEIHYTCQWGTGRRWGDGPNDTGMSRLSLSDADKEVRDWFVGTTKELGCNVTIDAMGNIFAVRPGRRSGPPTCVGSHLDTQPTGGRYDGILGVCAGVEMLKVFKDEKIETEYPIGVINWTNEEGARFPMSMVSSGVWADGIPLEKAHTLKELGKGSKDMKGELERIGYLGDTAANYKTVPIGAHFELHIEQGPRLESSKLKIGVVQGVQAYKWVTIGVQGRDCHTGTTPFPSRQDAMLCAAKMIVESNRIASSLSGLASTGILTLSPGSVNTVPGDVSFSLDIRAPEDDIVSQMEQEMKKTFTDIALDTGGCQISWTQDFSSKAVGFHNDCIRCVEDSTKAVVGDEYCHLTSGAGHDSVFTSKRVPTSMIFVPCRNGVSHHPEEFCSMEDCANGTQVLMGAVLRYDAFRAQR